jgi:hypothetical protein
MRVDNDSTENVGFRVLKNNGAELADIGYGATINKQRMFC